MSGFRAYYKNLADVKIGGQIFLDGDQSRHLCGSLRACQGDEVSVFDLNGNAFNSKILDASPRGAKLAILKKLSVKKNKGEIILAQALPKGKIFDDIISSAMQIGAAKIVPIISEHTVVRLEKSEGLKKAQKWQTCVVEAMKQSGNLAGLAVCEPISFKDFMKASETFCGKNCVKIVCSLEREKAKPILESLENFARESDSVCVLIGPEGDFSEREYSAAYEAGFAPVSLGENVMKCEVAATFAMSVVSAFLNAKG